MATYNTAFGALPGYKEMVGQQPGQFMQQQPQGDNQGLQAVSSRMNAQQAPAQTFSQMQQQGQARPAPPQPQPYQQYGGSQQAQQARQAMLNQLQQQLAQPTRFDTDAFNQIRQAQAANLQTEFGAQRQMMDEEMARRGLMASSIASGRFGDLAGQQARALADLDAQLLSQAAQTQAGDRLAAMQAGGQFAELAGSQDLSEFEANRVAQAQEFQEALQAAQFGEGSRQFDVQQALQELLGIGQLTGQVGGAQTLAAGQLGLEQQRLAEQRRQFDVQQQLQEQLGLGGLGIQQREVELRAQQLQQEAQLQGRSLSIEEARLAAQQEQFQQSQSQQAQQFAAQLGISTQELALRSQQLQQEATQFGLSLSEQQANRMQQLGLSTQELALRTQQIQQEGQLQGRSLSIQEAQNQAINQLERDRLGQQSRQFDIQQALEAELGRGGLALDQERIELQRQQFIDDLEERRSTRLQQFGLSNQELELRAQELQQQARTQNRTLELQAARDEAEVDLRSRALVQEAQLQGRSLDLQAARDQAQKDQFDAQLEQAESEFSRSFGLQADRFDEEKNQFLQTFQQQQLLRLAEQTGFVHEVDANGNIVRTDQALNADVQRQLDRNLQTSLQQSEFTFRTQMENLSQVIRQSETSGFMHRLDENGNIVPVFDANGSPVQTSAAALEQSRQQLAAAEGNADRISREAIQRDVNDLNRETAIMRQQIELGQQTGTMWEIGPDGQLVNTGRPTSQKELADKTFKLNQTIEMSQLRGMIFDPETGEFTGGETAANTAARLDRQLRQQLGLTDAMGFMYNPVTGTFDRTQETVGRTSARAQAELAQQNLIIQMMQALGFGNEELIRTILGLGKDKNSGTSSGTAPKTSDTDADQGTDNGDGMISGPTRIQTGTGNPSTWGDIDPETGKAWENGRILQAEDGSSWRYLNGRWQPYTAF
jgi:hypothetical protein